MEVKKVIVDGEEINIFINNDEELPDDLVLLDNNESLEDTLDLTSVLSSDESLEDTLDLTSVLSSGKGEE